MANFCLGDKGFGLSMVGMNSGLVPGSFVGSWLGNGELRRLTMRGFTLPRLLTHFSVAASRSNSLNQRRRSRGRSGGKSPGAGLSAAYQLNVPCE